MEKEINFNVILLEDGNYQLETERGLYCGSASLGEIVGAIVERIISEREELKAIAEKKRLIDYESN